MEICDCKKRIIFRRQCIDTIQWQKNTRSLFPLSLENTQALIRERQWKVITSFAGASLTRLLGRLTAPEGGSSEYPDSYDGLKSFGPNRDLEEYISFRNLVTGCSPFLPPCLHYARVPNHQSSLQYSMGPLLMSASCRMHLWVCRGAAVGVVGGEFRKRNVWLRRVVWRTRLLSFGFNMVRRLLFSSAVDPWDFCLRCLGFSDGDIPGELFAVHLVIDCTHVCFDFPDYL